MKKHLQALGFSSTQAYFRWCAAANFPVSLEKSRCDMDCERRAFERQKETQKEQGRVHHNPVRFLVAACLGGIEPDQVTRPGWHEVCDASARSPKDKQSRRTLSDFLTMLQTKTKFVFATTAFGTQTFGSPFM